ncbi:IQ-DOMAIN 14-like protein [Tanacetum coccineum]|uniref:IQ-DOMAIN 14-like protein n=1 Tax=Tanacetum coccineum TaxID=301880 RepID=A0ABQ5BKU0_9ASTR
MGKVSRWFRGVLGMKKDKENIDNSNAKRKKRWRFGKCMKDPSQWATVENDSSRMRSCMSASEKEQNKHVIAIAATATAAADVAVAGPEALVAVVKLSTDDMGTLFSGREKWAATKIQSVYRGHLMHGTYDKKRDMGKVSRWFRGVLGMKKDKENIDNSNDKRKKRWSFGKCMKDPSQRATVENDSTRMRSCMSASEKEQNEHVIAIAATATAAADVAVAGPQALVAVVRLSSDGRGTLFSAGKNGLPPRFNQYIEARRAHRALRGLVKFQAIVKGFLVRKRVAATLYSMQALLRAQLDVRFQRAQLAVRSQFVVQPQMRHRQSTIRSLL